MAWAQNLLGFCFFACASQARFSWVLSGSLRAFKSYVVQRFALLEATFFLCFYLYLVGSKSNVSAFFWLRFRMAWALFLEFGLVACRLPSLTLRKGLPCGFAWLGHDLWLWSNGGVFDDGAPPWDFFRCVRLSEPLRQRRRAHAFLESCLQRLPN